MHFIGHTVSTLLFLNCFLCLSPLGAGGPSSKVSTPMSEAGPQDSGRRTEASAETALIAALQKWHHKLTTPVKRGFFYERVDPSPLEGFLRRVAFHENNRFTHSQAAQELLNDLPDFLEDYLTLPECIKSCDKEWIEGCCKKRNRDEKRLMTAFEQAFTAAINYPVSHQIESAAKPFPSLKSAV